MAIEGECEAHNLAVSAGELERVRAPPMTGADRRDGHHARAAAGVRYGVRARDRAGQENRGGHIHSGVEGA